MSEKSLAAKWNKRFRILRQGCEVEFPAQEERPARKFHAADPDASWQNGRFALLSFFTGKADAIARREARTLSHRLRLLLRNSEEMPLFAENGILSSKESRRDGKAVRGWKEKKIAAENSDPRFEHRGHRYLLLHGGMCVPRASGKKGRGLGERERPEEVEGGEERSFFRVVNVRSQAFARIYTAGK